MNKTRVDDMLIEMISPKIKEIEEKFSQGKGLNSEDINTLLLKSQYNHINHLEDKLNEVTLSVVGLENRFVGLENKVTSDIASLKNEFKLLNEKIETTIQKALNKNMIQLVLILGAFATIFKMIEIKIKI